MPHIRYEWKEPCLSIIVDDDLAAIINVSRKEDNSGFSIIINDHLVACSNSLQDYEGRRRLLVSSLHEDKFLKEELMEIVSRPENEELMDIIMKELTQENENQQE